MSLDVVKDRKMIKIKLKSMKDLKKDKNMGIIKYESVCSY